MTIGVDTGTPLAVAMALCSNYRNMLIYASG